MKQDPFIVVSGGAGFIGSNFASLVLKEYPDSRILIYDALTYAGNLENIPDNCEFLQGRIEDTTKLRSYFSDYGTPDYLVNFAAETHNDRSILNPLQFIKTNVEGVGSLCELVKDFKIDKFIHVSSDESYGSILSGEFKEEDKLDPNSPYSASKASGDLLCMAYHRTYGLPVCVTRGGNTYGNNQYPEKLIPFFITRLLDNKPIPVYGTGLAIREWIHVQDHCSGILRVLESGVPGEIYNIGDDNGRTNLEVIRILLDTLERNDSLIKYVEDPRGKAHDMRYSMNTEKISKLGWKPQIQFDSGMSQTINWYKNNENWWRNIQEKEEFKGFIQKFYGKLLGEDL